MCTAVEARAPLAEAHSVHTGDLADPGFLERHLTRIRRHTVARETFVPALIDLEPGSAPIALVHGLGHGHVGAHAVERRQDGALSILDACCHRRDRDHQRDP